MLNRINQLGLILAVVAFAGLGTAHAQDEDMANPCETDNPCETGGEEEWSEDSGEEGGEEGGEAAMDDAAGGDEAAGHHPGQVVASGKIKINAALGVGLSTDFVGDPIALAPDVIYGVMDKLDAGVYHTAMGITGFWSQSGGGLCLAGDFCGDVYNGPTGILANYSISNDQLSIAAGGGVVLSNIAGDTMFMNLKAGAKIRYMIDDKMGIQVDPTVFVGLNERDFNKETLFVPAAFMYAIDAKIHAGVQSGIAGPLDGFGDSYIIPLNVAGMYQIDSKLGVGGNFGFANIGGKGSTADARDLTIFASYAL